MHDWRSLSHVRWECKYHVVITPKYRKKVFFGKRRNQIGEIIRELCRQRGIELLEGHAMPDHIHMFLKVPPTISPAGVVKILKGVSAKILFEMHPSLRDSWKKGHLWSPSYYLGSVGHVSQESVKRYIETQKKRAVGRPRLVNSSTD